MAHGVSTKLIEFIEACPSMFHTTATIRTRLEAAGFEHLSEGDSWNIAAGGRYVITRNNSSVIAIRVGKQALNHEGGMHFQLTAAHGDSPTFKIKSTGELEGPGKALRLDVEAYGGMIDYTWFDRPLSVAGRVLVREGDSIVSRLIAPDRDLAIIPSLAIHLDRSVNSEFSPNRAVDLVPLISVGKLKAGDFEAYIAQEAGVDPSQVLARDLFLVNRQSGRIWGVQQEFVSAPKLDDLMCAFASLEAFMQAENEHCVSVYCCFDNEEVGSNTKQGAMSTFLADVLSRVSTALGLTAEEHLCAIARSMLVSCDNAHALHPNRPERYDEINRCYLNGGVVIKEEAGQRYCTDAFSRAVFVALCERAGVPWQSFANRSDSVGGSTLGNLSNMQVSVHAVDIGCPQLAMHASYETAGVRDAAYMIDALTAFFEADLAIDGADAVSIG
ncbi:M18 family aminopeptidase [Collinsella sp. AGMB00827]|uniref:M18 family aminopeptidase n=1 Tax=Collinsella ureilytica TaxID=2869515 RepID=A0ABS7MJY3_9ACTN|nr:M18 family aminopeptidase [Collinsella urealyticum]MBY4797681.1 M18 family aminopeptidase [Collinsella urealyticum]